MNDSTELATIPKESVLTVFSADNGLDYYMAHIRSEIDSFVPDVTTKKGRDGIASIAFKVAKSKTYLDGLGKDLVAELKELPKKIDSERKRMRDTLDAWRDEVRHPLTAWEDAEKQRVKAHQDAVEAIAALGTDLDGIQLDALKENLERVTAVQLGDHWEEFSAMAGVVKDKASAALSRAIVARAKYDDEQKELVRLRLEAEERAQKEREEAIARLAAEQERIKAEKDAQAERMRNAAREAEAMAVAERRELELRLAAEKSERENLEAQQRADKAIRDAAEMAEKAAQAERQRQADEAAEIDRQTKAREADKAHKADINNEALASFIAGGLSDECAKLAVTLIAKKKITNVTINY